MTIFCLLMSIRMLQTWIIKRRNGGVLPPRPPRPPRPGPRKGDRSEFGYARKRIAGVARKPLISEEVELDTLRDLVLEPTPYYFQVFRPNRLVNTQGFMKKGPTITDGQSKVSGGGRGGASVRAMVGSAQLSWVELGQSGMVRMLTSLSSPPSTYAPHTASSNPHEA